MEQPDLNRIIANSKLVYPGATVTDVSGKVWIIVGPTALTEWYFTVLASDTVPGGAVTIIQGPQIVGWTI